MRRINLRIKNSELFISDISLRFFTFYIHKYLIIYTRLRIPDGTDFGIQIIFRRQRIAVFRRVHFRVSPPAFLFPLLLLFLSFPGVPVALFAAFHVHGILVLAHPTVVERRVHQIPSGRRPYGRRPLQYLRWNIKY